MLGYGNDREVLALLENLYTANVRFLWIREIITKTPSENESINEQQYLKRHEASYDNLFNSSPVIQNWKKLCVVQREYDQNFCYILITFKVDNANAKV